MCGSLWRPSVDGPLGWQCLRFGKEGANPEPTILVQRDWPLVFLADAEKMPLASYKQFVISDGDRDSTRFAD